MDLQNVRARWIFFIAALLTVIHASGIARPLASELPGFPAPGFPTPGFPLPGSQASPRRIISLIPAVTEMLFAMGSGNQVVGVSSFDKYPPEVASRQKVGALLDPDIERILALKPDLVVVYGTQQELIARLAERVFHDSTISMPAWRTSR